MVNNNLFKIKTSLEKYIGIWRNSIKTWVTLTLKKKNSKTRSSIKSPDLN